MVDTKIETTNKFDIDLKFGLIFERKIRDIFENGGKIEVKTERDSWHRTGNIAIEIECSGKPSGLSVTTANYWIHVLSLDDEMQMALLFPVVKLKELVKRAIRMPDANIVYGGDRKASKIILLPISEVLLV